MANPSVPERQSPAFSFYPADFLVGTATFSLEESGAYMRLLCYQWTHGCIPDDGTERARLLNCTQKRADALWRRLHCKFYRDDDGSWRNERLEQERAKQAAFRLKQSENGKHGGRPKAKGNPDETQALTQTEPKVEPKKSLSSSSSSSSSTPITQRAELSGDTPAERAGNFCEWYSEAHSRFVGVGYIGNPRKDYEASLQMVAKFTDAELRDAAIVWFGMDDDFATSGTRTVTKFASRATHCVGLARRVVA